MDDETLENEGGFYGQPARPWQPSGPTSWVPPSSGPGPYTGVAGEGSGEGLANHSPEAERPPHHGRHRLAATSAAVALLAGGVGAAIGVGLSGGGAAGANGSSGAERTVSVPHASDTSGHTLTTQQVYDRVEPAVVDINTTVASGTMSGGESAAGTGMILTSNGEVLTNNHVVEDATSIKVTVQGRSGSFAAKVIGVDPTKDVALLQLEGVKNALPTVSLANSSTVQVGAAVVAVGNALGLGRQPSVVTGQVTALGRTITASDSGSGANSETLHGMIQTDADIVPGDSGGPLLDSSGQVVGMDTAALTSDAGATTAFSIPINTAVSLADHMAKGQAVSGIILGESPFLGIEELTSTSANSGYGSGGYYGGGFGGFGSTGSTGSTVSGVQIYDVTTNGPAYEAGLRPGDTITSIDSKATPTSSVLSKEIASLKIGEKATVSYVDQSGASHSVTVTIGAIPK